LEHKGTKYVRHLARAEPSTHNACVLRSLAKCPPMTAGRLPKDNVALDTGVRPSAHCRCRVTSLRLLYDDVHRGDSCAAGRGMQMMMMVMLDLRIRL